MVIKIIKNYTIFLLYKIKAEIKGIISNKLQYQQKRIKNIQHKRSSIGLLLLI